jgi:hypothetical protein
MILPVLFYPESANDTFGHQRLILAPRRRSERLELSLKSYQVHEL